MNLPALLAEAYCKGWNDCFAEHSFSQSNGVDMSFSIHSEQFTIHGRSSIPGFQKRGTLAMTLITSAVETALKFCEELSEDELADPFFEWKDHSEIVSAFLETDLFPKWCEMVALDLGGHILTPE